MNYKTTLWSIAAVMLIVGISLFYAQGYHRLQIGVERSSPTGYVGLASITGNAITVDVGTNPSRGDVIIRDDKGNSDASDDTAITIPRQALPNWDLGGRSARYDSSNSMYTLSKGGYADITVKIVTSGGTTEYTTGYRTRPFSGVVETHAIGYDGTQRREAIEGRVGSTVTRTILTTIPRGQKIEIGGTEYTVTSAQVQDDGSILITTGQSGSTEVKTIVLSGNRAVLTEGDGTTKETNDVTAAAVTWSTNPSPRRATGESLATSIKDDFTEEELTKLGIKEDATGYTLNVDTNDQINFELDEVGENLKNVKVQRYFENGESGVILETTDTTGKQHKYRLTDELGDKGKIEEYDDDAGRWRTRALDKTLGLSSVDAEELADKILDVADEGQENVEEYIEEKGSPNGRRKATPEQQWKHTQQYNRFLSYGRAKMGAYFDSLIEAAYPTDKMIAGMCGDEPHIERKWTRTGSALWPLGTWTTTTSSTLEAQMLNDFSYINLEGEKEEITEDMYRYSITLSVLPSAGIEFKLFLHNSCTDESSEENAEGHQFADAGRLFRGQVFRKHYADAEGEKMTFTCSEDGACRFNEACFAVVDIDKPKLCAVDSSEGCLDGEAAHRAQIAFDSAQRTFGSQICRPLALGAGFTTPGTTGTREC